MKLRISFVGLVSLAGAAVACGSTAFSSGDSPDDSGPGTDSRTGDDARPGSDGATRTDGPATHDAAGDSPTSPDGGADGNLPPPVEASVDAPVDSPADAPADATTPGADGGGSDGGTTCATKTTSDGSGVFLVSGGSGTGCQRDTPCGTFENAIAALGTNAGTPGGKSIVFVGPGTFLLADSVAVPDGVTIQGGWKVSNSNTWTGSCDAGDTPDLTTAAPQVLTVGSAATPSKGTVTLDTVNVTNTLIATTGQSVYGVFAVGNGASSLVLNHVDIQAPNAGGGATGASGSTGQAGQSGGCMEAAGGALGTPTSPTTGSYSNDGYSPKPASAEGGQGGTGATPAAVTTCGPAYNMGCSDLPACTATGGVPVCEPAVASGCGGGGGLGGFSGGGGGSSIALYLWSENAALTSGSLAAGSGGSGGAGGAGGAGGQPGSPAPGGTTTLTAVACVIKTIPGGDGDPPTQVCDPERTDEPLTILPGSAGSPGYAGGQGAGGSGGDSYAYYAGPSSSRPTVTTVGNVTFSPSSAGTGGTGGTPGGSNGFSGKSNTQD